MIQNGIFGKGRGKAGNSVWSISHGQQIVRSYNSNVTNPNSIAQVEARNKLALISQLSAAVSSVIAIPRKGNLSPRNRFTAVNRDLLYAADTSVLLPLDKLQLTDSSLYFSDVFVIRAGAQMQMLLIQPAPTSISRVIYNVFAVDTSGRLNLVGSYIANEAGNERRFPLALSSTAGELLFLAYGMADRSHYARMLYRSYHINSGQRIASLVASRGLSFNRFSFTRTSGVILARGATNTPFAAEGFSLFSVETIGEGEATINGMTIPNLPVQNGTSVILHAEPSEGSAFVAWYVAGSQIEYSSDNQCTFVANSSKEFIAKFKSIN